MGAKCRNPGAALGGLATLLAACGAPPEDVPTSEIEVAWDSGVGGNPLLAFQEPASFALATAPSSFVIRVSGCASGFSKVFDSAVVGSRVAILRGDSGCVAALRSFVWKGARWTREGGGDFAGDGMAVFEDLSLGRRVFVANPERLSGEPSQRVVFRLHEVEAGFERQLLIPGARGAITSQSGSREGPFLGWFLGPQEVSLTNVSAPPASQATFRVKLQCAGTFTQRSPLTTSTCKVGGSAQTLSEFYLRIVPDTYANGGGLTWATARNLFGASWPPSAPGVVDVGNDSQVFPSGVWGPGGIQVDVTTTTPVLSCRNYLLLVLRGNGTVNRWSFTWFNLDFATAGTTCP